MEAEDWKDSEHNEGCSGSAVEQVGQVDKPVGKEEDIDHLEQLSAWEQVGQVDKPVGMKEDTDHLEQLDQVVEYADQLEILPADEQHDHAGQDTGRC